MKVLLVGAGRTGSHAAEILAQNLSGKHQLAVVDRDALEESNLEGCVLYSKKEVGELKAPLLARKISRTSSAEIIAFAEHLSLSNIGEIATGARVILDCTDNWQTRILINEHCWKKRIAWVYAGAIKGRAMCSTIVPQKTPCFTCWAGKPSRVRSCSEEGVEQSALEKISRVQAREALSIVRGKKPLLAGRLFFLHNGFVFNAEKNFEKTVLLQKNPECEFCALGKSLYAEGNPVVLCGGKQWLFRNDFNEKNAAEIYALLEGLERRIVGQIVKVKTARCEASVLASGSVIVRAKNEGHASAANQAIAQKIS